MVKILKFGQFRKWIAYLDNYMPDETKKMLKKTADDAGIQMVKKQLDSDGRVRVCKT